MTEPLSLEAQVERAEAARQIIQAQLFQDTWAEMETAIVDKIAQCPLEAEFLRTRLCMALGTLRTFRQVLESHMETGKMAVMQLGRKEGFR
mgnify:CR=1 FL=1